MTERKKLLTPPNAGKNETLLQNKSTLIHKILALPPKNKRIHLESHLSR